MFIPNSLIELGQGSFMGCIELSEATLSSNLTEVKIRTFKNTALTTIVIPQGVTIIGNAAFRNTSLETISLPDTVTEIGGFAFYESKLKEITLSNSLNSIGANAFGFCINVNYSVIELPEHRGTKPRVRP